MKIRVLFLSLLLSVASAAPSLAAGERLALVIGNAKYPDAEAPLRERLALARSIREYAARELALPDNASYRSYAELDRPYAVWNVVAAPEFSLEPLQSCFPVAGCVSYRGFFSQAAAERHAERLRGEGYDVFVYGVAAYSTLGRFDDPLLSTFIRYPEAELARLEQSGVSSRRVPLSAPISGVVTELGVREGAMVQAGMPAFTITDLSSVWVVLEVPEAQGALLRQGQKVEVRVQTLPERTFEGRLDYVYPELNAQTRTVKARATLANPGLALKPGMFGDRRGAAGVLAGADASAR